MVRFKATVSKSKKGIRKHAPKASNMANHEISKASTFYLQICCAKYQTVGSSAYKCQLFYYRISISSD